MKKKYNYFSLIIMISIFISCSSDTELMKNKEYAKIYNELVYEMLYDPSSKDTYIYNELLKIDSTSLLTKYILSDYYFYLGEYEKSLKYLESLEEIRLNEELMKRRELFSNIKVYKESTELPKYNLVKDKEIYGYWKNYVGFEIQMRLYKYIQNEYKIDFLFESSSCSYPIKRNAKFFNGVLEFDKPLAISIDFVPIKKMYLINYNNNYYFIPENEIKNYNIMIENWGDKKNIFFDLRELCWFKSIY